jgi:iron complex outermembrane receptor protein
MEALPIEGEALNNFYLTAKGYRGEDMLFSRKTGMSASKISNRRFKVEAVSIAALLIAAPAMAFAQDANTAKPDNTEVVVVKGLRGSLQKSIKVKRASLSIVEVVSAEEIGKLPDSSIAESLSRLAGVAGQRVNGDVQVVNIRGTSPDFTVTTLNGRMQGSLGDARGVEVDQYPSELIESAVVYKTPDAAILGMGLSGTIDLKTRRPLSYKERAIAVNLRAETSTGKQLNPDFDKDGWRGSVSYIDQFMDGKLGVSLGYAHMDTTSQVQHQKIWGWMTNNTPWNIYDGAYEAYLPGATGALADANYLSGFELRAGSLNKVRDGAVAVFEFKPTDNWHTTLDLYYSKMKQTEVIRDIETNTFWTNDVGYAGLPIAGAVLGEFNGTPTIVSGTYTGMTPIQNNQLNTREDDVLSVGLNHEMRAGIWDLNFDVSYSKSEGKHSQTEVFAGYGTGSRTFDTINFSIPSDGFMTITPGLDYSDGTQMNLGDSAPWGGWGADGHIRYPHVKDSYANFSVSGKTDLKDTFAGKIFDSLQVGIGGWSHTKDKSVDEYDLFLKVRPENKTTFDNRPAAPETPYGVGLTDLTWAGWGYLYAFDIPAAVAGSYNIVPYVDDNHYSKTWSLSEDVFNIFTKLNIDTELLGRSLRGNLGVQYVMTNTESTGTYITTGGSSRAPTLMTIDNEYSDVLPSLNLSYQFTPKQYLRLGLAKQMARPRTDEMRANIGAGFSQVQIFLPGTEIVDSTKTYYIPSGSGGNPKLKPWRATAYDISYENYFGRKSMFAIAGYYKDVDSYIYSDTIDFDFTGLANPQNYNVIDWVGQLTTPVNGKGGYIKGIELQANLDFGDLYSPLDGFGISGNYTKNWTDIKSNKGGDTTIPGFSGVTYNFAAYYEKYGWQARVSYSYRDPAYSDVAGLYGTRAYTTILDNIHVDAQIGYEFQDGPFKNMTITLQGYNITDEPYVTSAGNLLTGAVMLPETYETYGTKYLLGVSYKF